MLENANGLPLTSSTHQSARTSIALAHALTWNARDGAQFVVVGCASFLCCRYSDERLVSVMVVVATQARPFWERQEDTSRYVTRSSRLQSKMDKLLDIQAQCILSASILGALFIRASNEIPAIGLAYRTSA